MVIARAATHSRSSRRGYSSQSLAREAKLVAYGSVNVYEIDGKAYYGWRGKFTRAPERDYLIKRSAKTTGVLE